MSGGLPAIASTGTTTASLIPNLETLQGAYLREVFSKYIERSDKTLKVPEYSHRWKDFPDSAAHRTFKKTFLTKEMIESVSRSIFRELNNDNPVLHQGIKFRTDQGIWFAKFCDGKLQVYYYHSNYRKLEKFEPNIVSYKVLNVFEARFCVLHLAHGPNRALIHNEFNCLKKLDFPFKYQAVFILSRSKLGITVEDSPSLLDYLKMANGKIAYYQKLEELKTQAGIFNQQIEAMQSLEKLTDEQKLTLQGIIKQHTQLLDELIHRSSQNSPSATLQAFLARSYYRHLDMCTNLLYVMHTLHSQGFALGNLKLSSWMSPNGHRWQPSNYYCTLHMGLDAKQAVEILQGRPYGYITTGEFNQIRDASYTNHLTTEQILAWAQSQDVFALGVIFYQVLTMNQNAHPYMLKPHVSRDGKWIPADPSSANTRLLMDDQVAFKSDPLHSRLYSPELIQLLKEMMAVNPSERPKIEEALPRWKRLVLPILKTAAFQDNLETEEQFKEKILAHFRDLQTALTREKVTAACGQVYAQLKNAASVIYANGYCFGKDESWHAKVENGKLHFYYMLFNDVISTPVPGFAYRKVINLAEGCFSMHRLGNGTLLSPFTKNENDCLVALGNRSLLPQVDTTFVYVNQVGLATQNYSNLKEYLTGAMDGVREATSLKIAHRSAIQNLHNKAAALVETAEKLSSHEKLKIQTIEKEHTDLRREANLRNAEFITTSDTKYITDFLYKKHLDICTSLLRTVHELHSKNLACGNLSTNHWVTSDGQNWLMEHLLKTVHPNSNPEQAVAMLIQDVNSRYVTLMEINQMQKGDLQKKPVEDLITFVQRWDMFALGVIFYELLALDHSVHPYSFKPCVLQENQWVQTDENHPKFIWAIDNDANFNPESIRMFCPELKELIKKMVAKDPSQRPTTGRLLKEWTELVSPHFPSKNPLVKRLDFSEEG